VYCFIALQRRLMTVVAQQGSSEYDKYTNYFRCDGEIQHAFPCFDVFQLLRSWKECRWKVEQKPNSERTAEELSWFSFSGDDGKLPRGMTRPLPHHSSSGRSPPLCFEDARPRGGGDPLLNPN
jgi:hypothetical protein